MELVCNECSDAIIVDNEEEARDEGWGQVEQPSSSEKVWVCADCLDELHNDEDEND